MKSDEMFAGFSVAAGDDRFGEHIKLGGPNGEPIDCKVSAQDTEGAMCIFEFNCNSGGPRHLHYDQDEWIYIIEGEFEFHLGETEHSTSAPANRFHPPQSTTTSGPESAAGPGKVINVYQPAGRWKSSSAKSASMTVTREFSRPSAARSPSPLRHLWNGPHGAAARLGRMPQCGYKVTGNPPASARSAGTPTAAGGKA